MRPQLLDLLCRPDCRGELVLRDAAEVAGRVVEDGHLERAGCSPTAPICSSISRFAPESRYYVVRTGHVVGRRVNRRVAASAE